MIEPKTITNFNSSTFRLQNAILFWIAVAGKTANTVAPRLNNCLKLGRQISKKHYPFEVVKHTPFWSTILQQYGIGCYNQKSSSMIEVATSGLNLRTCSVKDLERIKGIGPKTARCFVVHSRKDARYACLDTHILKYMKRQGIKVPNITPKGSQYLELEKEFLKLVPPSVSVAEFDFKIWSSYAK